MARRAVGPTQQWLGEDNRMLSAQVGLFYGWQQHRADRVSAYALDNVGGCVEGDQEEAAQQKPLDPSEGSSTGDACIPPALLLSPEVWAWLAFEERVGRCSIGLQCSGAPGLERCLTIWGFQSRRGSPARSLYATPPSPPLPPRVLTDSGVGPWRHGAEVFYVHASLSSNRPCFERQISKTRHYTNVVCFEAKILHSEPFPSSGAVPKLSGANRGGGVSFKAHPARLLVLLLRRGTFQGPLSRSPSIFSFNPQL